MFAHDWPSLTPRPPSHTTTLPTPSPFLTTLPHQVLLYLLLLEERYGQRMDWGVLWLTGQADPTLIRRQHAELAALLAVRNRCERPDPRRGSGSGTRQTLLPRNIPSCSPSLAGSPSTW